MDLLTVLGRVLGREKGRCGASGGYLMGAGEGSGGLRICLPTWRNLVGRVSSCEGAVRAFRCKKFANGSRGPLALAAGDSEPEPAISNSRSMPEMSSNPAKQNSAGPR